MGSVQLTKKHSTHARALKALVKPLAFLVQGPKTTSVLGPGGGGPKPVGFQTPVRGLTASYATMLTRVRQVVRQYSGQHQDVSALYWADKALSLSNGALEDIIVYIQCLYACQEYKRAIHYLESSALLQQCSTLRYLSAR